MNTFYPMILKRKWIIGNTNYCRVKIRMTLENISEIYNICTDCVVKIKSSCNYSSVECLRTNMKLSRNKILYRYFPDAHKKKTWV